MSKNEPLQRGINLEEIGEGWLGLGSDGQGLEIFRHDLIAKLNAPSRKDRVDAAHLARLNGTDFVQWYGRKSDGRFWPIGRIMRLTAVGKKALDEQGADESSGMIDTGIERFHLPEGKTWKDVKWGTLFLAFKDGTFDSLDYDERPQDTARPDAAEDKSLGATSNQNRG